MIAIETFVDLLDLGGTFVFAISGAVAAVNRRLDIFGILVLRSWQAMSAALPATC